MKNIFAPTYLFEGLKFLVREDSDEVDFAWVTSGFFGIYPHIFTWIAAWENT